MSFLRRIFGRPDDADPAAEPAAPPDPMTEARARAASYFADDWNPEPDELRAWAYADVPAPAPDFEFGVYDHVPVSILADLAADKACPKREFFVRCLYLRVWDALRGGARLPEQRSAALDILHTVPPSDDPLLVAWHERSSRLIDGETPWTADWADRAARTGGTPESE